MNRNVKISLILGTLIVVALLAAFWATAYTPSPIPPPWRPRGLPTGSIRGDIELFYTVKTVVSSLNATLLVLLMLAYIHIYVKTKSTFTVALLIFSAVLLLYAFSSNPLVHWTFGYYAFGLGPFAMLPDLFALVALCILLYVTLKY